MLPEILAVARKEFRGFFASPAAYLFIGGFLAVTLFIVFWVSAFFARNIADVAPMFAWMPVADDLPCRRADHAGAGPRSGASGTLEMLLTTPVRPLSLVARQVPRRRGAGGAGAAPDTAAAADRRPSRHARLGAGDRRLRRHPVPRRRLCRDRPLRQRAKRQSGDFADRHGAGLRRLLPDRLEPADQPGRPQPRRGCSTSSAPARASPRSPAACSICAIIYYYLSIVGVFLALNVLQLHRLRWAGNPGGAAHRATLGVAVLAVANLLVANFWLAPVTTARIDLTADHRYTLSDATQDRARRAARAAGHPRLFLVQDPSAAGAAGAAAPRPAAPNMPSPAAAGCGSRSSTRPAIRRRRSRRPSFGIRPTPFQTANRYSSSVVNSYFDIVVSYGGAGPSARLPRPDRGEAARRERPAGRARQSRIRDHFGDPEGDPGLSRRRQRLRRGAGRRDACTPISRPRPSYRRRWRRSVPR